MSKASTLRAGNAWADAPQAGGMLPETRLPFTDRYCSFAQLPGSAQESGKDPAEQEGCQSTVRALCRSNACFNHFDKRPYTALCCMCPRGCWILSPCHILSWPQPIVRQCLRLRIFPHMPHPVLSTCWTWGCSLDSCGPRMCWSSQAPSAGHTQGQRHGVVCRALQGRRQRANTTS